MVCSAHSPRGRRWCRLAKVSCLCLVFVGGVVGSWPACLPAYLPGLYGGRVGSSAASWPLRWNLPIRDKRRASPRTCMRPRTHGLCFLSVPCLHLAGRRLGCLAVGRCHVRRQDRPWPRALARREATKNTQARPRAPYPRDFASLVAPSRASNILSGPFWAHHRTDASRRPRRSLGIASLVCLSCLFTWISRHSA